MRTTAGTYLYFAATQTNLYRMLSDYTWELVTRTSGGAYAGPDAGDLWTAALFGPYFLVSNWNDVLQKFNIDDGYRLR